MAETSAALVIESKGKKAVNGGVIKNIGWAMLLRIPASALVGAVTFFLVRGLVALVS